MVASVTLISCDNKPPYLRLAAAIDSLNAQYDRTHDTKDKFITYEKWENQVHFHIEVPVVIDNDAFEAQAENIKQRFLENLVTDDEFGIATEILDAKANIVIEIQGLNDTKYDVLIVTNEITEAYDAAREVQTEEELLDRAEAERIASEVDTLSPAEVEQELLEGNAPSIAAEENKR